MPMCHSNSHESYDDDSMPMCHSNSQDADSMPMCHEFAVLKGHACEPC
jgi:hypothetical protein